MNGSRTPVPVVFWGVVNRGGEQAAQHSQALHATFSHVPGLKVVMPADAARREGVDDRGDPRRRPVVFHRRPVAVQHRGRVPEEPYAVPIGKGIVRREGKDVSLIAASWAVAESMKAAALLEGKGVDAEVVDLRTVKPLDVPLILASAGKTGRAVIVDSGWKTCGLAAEVAAVIAENGFGPGRAPVSIRRVALPDLPAPARRTLEVSYFLDARKIAEAVMA
jgi:pyruvate dehydrogenase E1 component beta subunit